MKCILRSLVGVIALAGVAQAGNPHFVSCTPSVSGDTVCVVGKEAGLGNEDQVNIVLTVIAHCQNRGGNDPSAQNKETFGATGTFPVQNGKATYEVCVETEFKPACSPPMSVIVDAVTLVDVTPEPDISCSLSLQQ